jgi:hypothetical protein
MLHLEQQSHVRASLVGGIQRGMPVYDVELILLGIVARIHRGQEADEFITKDIESLMRSNELDAELIADLRRVGYIEIDTGLLSGNYFVLPHQIADVTEEGVFLLSSEDELLQY